MMEQRGVKLGGWRPVFRRRHIGGESNSTGEVHNVFVNNLTDSMHPKRLYDLFTNFGVVTDVYIPSKMRHLTGTRFGFVKYDCPVAVEMAIQKAHDTWCDDRALKIKRIDFTKNLSKVKPQADFQHLPPVEIGKRWMRVEIPSTKGISYAEAVMGGKVTSGKSISVNVKEYGNRWLYDSVIVKLWSHYQCSDLKKELHTRGMSDVQVKDGGGRVAYLVFSSPKVRNRGMKNIKDWIHEWCESMVEWWSGLKIEQERYVGLNCYGLPPNLWNTANFIKIGEIWGKVMNINESILKMSSMACSKIRILTSHMEMINNVFNLGCRGQIHSIRVSEELGPNLVYVLGHNSKERNASVNNITYGDQISNYRRVGFKGHLSPRIQ